MPTGESVVYTIVLILNFKIGLQSEFFNLQTNDLYLDDDWTGVHPVVLVASC